MIGPGLRHWDKPLVVSHASVSPSTLVLWPLSEVEQLKGDDLLSYLSLQLAKVFQSRILATSCDYALPVPHSGPVQLRGFQGIWKPKRESCSSERLFALEVKVLLTVHEYTIMMGMGVLVMNP